MVNGIAPALEAADGVGANGGVAAAAVVRQTLVHICEAA